MEKTVYSFAKNAMEEIRVGITEFRGDNFIDIRVWLDKGGEWIRTRKGITLSMERLNELKKGIAKLDKTIHKKQ